MNIVAWVGLLIKTTFKLFINKGSQIGYFLLSTFDQNKSFWSGLKSILK